MFSLLLILLGHATLYAGWHDRKAEGWAWYEDLQKPVKEEAPKPQTTAQQMQQARENIEEKLAKAVLEPTPENIKSYMEEQQKLLERSALFAKVWAQVLLNHPHLDYTATHLPVSQYGLQFYKNELQEKKETLIGILAKDFGLFYFYEGKNEISSVFGPIVRDFAQKYDYKTIAISIDDTEIEGFEGSKKDNGITQALGIHVTPALYLINPKTNVAIPIAFGLVAVDKIEDNIVLQFKELIGND